MNGIYGKWNGDTPQVSAPSLWEVFLDSIESRRGRTFLATLLTMLLLALLLPFANIHFIYPVFTDVLITATEEDAKRLGAYILPPSLKHSKLNPDSLTSRFFGNIFKLENDFGLLKIRVYSPDGFVLYSTDSSETGNKHKQAFFYEQVANGIPHSKLIPLGTRSDEGEVLGLDVVDAYVPYMSGKTFLGAFEMYYDVTARKQRLDELVAYSKIVMTVLSLTLILAAGLLLWREMSHRRNRKIAKELRREVESITRHDIKTPLISILNGVEYLEQFTSLDDEQRAMTADIRLAANTSMELINRSLDLFKMERGRYEYAPREVDLLILIRRSVKALSALADSLGVSVLLMVNGGAPDEKEAYLFPVDETLFYSLVSNLLKNAVEASTEGDQVTLSLTGEDDMRLTIHNPAVVPESIRSRFFDKFTTHGKVGGTGLGTYSARLIVRTMGGRISMATSKEGGTLVSVELPYTAENN